MPRPWIHAGPDPRPSKAVLPEGAGLHGGRPSRRRASRSGAGQNSLRILLGARSVTPSRLPQAARPRAIPETRLIFIRYARELGAPILPDAHGERRVPNA